MEGWTDGNSVSRLVATEDIEALDSTNSVRASGFAVTEVTAEAAAKLWRKTNGP